MSRYAFTEDMHEISGFGGEYEACCRRMLQAALEWLDSHPAANPQFHGYKNVYGIICEDNEDAKALSAAALAGAGDYGTSGAQHQAVISAALYIRANGWDAYVKAKTHPEGQVGILKEKLERATRDAEMWRERFFEMEREVVKRGEIIAVRVLHWKKHTLRNGQQQAYAPSAEAAAEGIDYGCSIHKLVDEAIAGMAA